MGRSTSRAMRLEGADMVGDLPCSRRRCSSVCPTAMSRSVCPSITTAWLCVLWGAGWWLLALPPARGCCGVGCVRSVVSGCASTPLRVVVSGLSLHRPDRGTVSVPPR